MNEPSVPETIAMTDAPTLCISPSGRVRVGNWTGTNHLTVFLNVVNGDHAPSEKMLVLENGAPS